ncbi:hypothetical protein EST38_g709 [Candolleomyces aberdarensis]|uniref:Uncharacterized protein n=1 Tax=Candolleomyces aberdarensis TaxID=2316362 RepID=A0A4Q2DZH1_9AGAR|nr:hypothetical protein EST38_g709 [Candolleomyces aberdarensis]
MLKNAPRDAMNTPVWNTMIWEALKAQRYQLAQSLYVDMKRRGFSPTTRTYQTLFSGLSRIERWNTFPKQLANARSLYDDFQRHITSLKAHDAYNPDITSTPLAGYIKILGNAGEYQEIFDVFYSLDQDGTYIANEFIYTAIFQALADMRQVLNGKGITAPSQWDAKVASDVRMLWNQMTKPGASQTKTNAKFSSSRPGPADQFAATAAISALSQGEDVDHELAFKIARDFFGLSKDEMSIVRGYYPLTRQSLGAILKLCNDAKQHSTCMHFFQLVKRSNKFQDILDRPHVEEVLKSRYHLPSGGLGLASLQLLEWMLQREKAGHGPQIRPAVSTYNLVLTACWKAADWPSAVTAFDLMTGYQAEDLSDEAVANGVVPRHDRFRREGNRDLVPPSLEALSSLARTANATRQRSNIRACLRLIDRIEPEVIFPGSPRGTGVNAGSGKTAKNKVFFATKLAQAVNEGWDLIKGYADEFSREEFLKWRSLKDRLNKSFNKKPAGYAPTKLIKIPDVV